MSTTLRNSKIKIRPMLYELGDLEIMRGWLDQRRDVTEESYSLYWANNATAVFAFIDRQDIAAASILPNGSICGIINITTNPEVPRDVAKAGMWDVVSNLAKFAEENSFTPGCRRASNDFDHALLMEIYSEMIDREVSRPI